MARKHPLDGPEQKVQNAIDAVRVARAAIRADPDWQRAVKLATSFWKALEIELNEAAKDRAFVVDKHYREQRLTIAALAEVMDVDPPRISQLRARAKKEAQDG